MRSVPAVVLGQPLRRVLDGSTDDLLTAGLGASGLRGPPPTFVNPLQPTATELRRRAIYQAYRGLLDVSDAGGFTRLYGPDSSLGIAGVEYLIAVQTPEGRGTTTVCLQIPYSFDVTRPLLLAVASSGSRGVYGGLPTAGEWGLRKGAAVVHTDKGTGNGAWDVDRQRGWRIDGRCSDDASDPLQIWVPPTDARLNDLPAHSILFKHAQSGLNVESRWGIYLLQAIQVALQLLSQERASSQAFTADNTLILAAGVSNGGATVLRAMEADGGAVIDGAVVSEPNAVLGRRTEGLELASGGLRWQARGFGLYDYANLHYLLQPAAVLAEHDPTAPFAATTMAQRSQHEQWCLQLQEQGILQAGSIANGASQARQLLLDAGMQASGLALGHFNLAAGLWPSVTLTYAAAYGRLKPQEMPYGSGFAMADEKGLPRRMSDQEAAAFWCDASGIAPTAGCAVMAEGADGMRCAQPYGRFAWALAFAPDRMADSARISRQARLDLSLSMRITEGHEACLMKGALGTRPVIMLHGRADGLIPVNHSSRAYYAVNQAQEGPSGLRYYELIHGQHFDGLLGLSEFACRYVPLQPWIGRSLDRVYDRLRGGPALPPSQVLRTLPREQSAAGLADLHNDHLGQWRDAPDDDTIEFKDHTLHVPL